jgi:hypothetical protein
MTVANHSHHPRFHLGIAVALGLMLLGLLLPRTAHAQQSTDGTPRQAFVLLSLLAGLPRAHPASFGAEQPSEPARRVADMVVATGDNRNRPFLLVDKVKPRLYVFDARGRLTAASTILLGAARGDDSVPGIGLRPIADIRPFERTTPAGRFVAQPGRNAAGEDIVWVDYDNAISMHRVRATNPAERRLQRMASMKAADHRISWGCINVPAAFYDAQIKPVFQRGRANVYVLPEVKPLAQTFHWPGQPARARPIIRTGYDQPILASVTGPFR